MKKDKFNVYGMSCAACEANVKKSVSKVKGVSNVEVSLLTNSMVVEHDDNLNLDIINKAVTKAGYSSCLENEKINKDDNKDNEFKNRLIKLIISIFLLLFLVYISMGYMLNINPFNLGGNPLVIGLISFILSFIIMYINKRFYISGFKALINRGPNMDTLVALGSGVAFIYSIILLFLMSYNLINGDMNLFHIYSMNLAFETAGMVPTLISIGKLLEAYSKNKTKNALNSLLELKPKIAHIIKNDEIIDIDASMVKKDDIFIVKPGEAIPCDGMIIEGKSSIDEAMLTGESIYNDKEVGDKIYSASININGIIKCRSDKDYNDTLFNKIIKRATDASTSKAKIAKIADKVAGIFVPIVLLISIIVFIIWMFLGNNYLEENQTLFSYAIERAISVLVISCPCALGLATPLSIMVSTGIGAKNQILYKNAEILEELAKVRYVLLDKTGTITKGMPKVKRIWTNEISDELFLSIAYGLELNSNHPLANAINNYAKANNIKPAGIAEFNEIAGEGVCGIYDNKKLYGINYKSAKNIIDLNDYNIFNELNDEALTPLIFILDNKLIGVIGVFDEIKEDSKEAIIEFKKLGITPIMITGDNEKAAKIVSDSLGIKYYYSSILPDQKEDIVKSFKSKGKVLMIGDGINDSIALSSADVGMSLSSGSDIAISSSDIILLNSSLKSATKAIRLSRLTLRNIKQNLFWAFIYNLIMIPIAAGAFIGLGLFKLKPYYGALAMSLSSIIVVLNSLRLYLININNPNKFNKKEIEDVDISLNNNINKLTINVKGMMCEHCINRVETIAKSNDWVIDAKANLDSATLVIEYEKLKDIDKIIKDINKAGYKAKYK